MANKLKFSPAGLPAPQIDTIALDAKWAWDYDKSTDIFHMFPGKPSPAMSVPVGDFWIEIDPADGTIVGFHIEGFSALFLPRHRDIASQWKALKLRTSEDKLHMMAEALLAAVRLALVEDMAAPVQGGRSQ